MGKDSGRANERGRRHKRGENTQLFRLDLRGGEAQFRLTASERTRSAWNHAFSASFVVSVKGMSLSLALSVLNEDSVPFQFTAALHTYLLVDDIRSSVVHGL